MSKHKERDLKSYFEAILGTELDLDDPGRVALRERIAAYTEQKGRTVSTEIGMTGDSSKGCADARLLDLSGIAKTGEDGTAELLLSNFFCGSRGFEWPAVVVATPRAQSPVFLTAQASPTTNRRDVRIRVATWDASGSPAPNQSFNWTCRVPVTRIID